MATLGETIEAARKRRNMTLEDLGAVVNMSRANLSVIERGLLKNGPDADTVNRIAEALQDNSIRLAYLETNSVFQAVIPRIFPELNNIRREPGIVFSRFADEAEEAVKAARALAQIFNHASPRSIAGFAESFAFNMDQIIDIQRCAEILMTSLITAQVISESERLDMYSRQQIKCEIKGHHTPREDDRRDPESAGCPSRCDQRTGSERRDGAAG